MATLCWTSTLLPNVELLGRFWDKPGHTNIVRTIEVPTDSLDNLMQSNGGTTTLESAVANAEQAARAANASLDVDTLFVKKAIINEGPKLKRWTPAAMGRAPPMIKRTSHVEIVVAEKEGR